MRVFHLVRGPLERGKQPGDRHFRQAYLAQNRLPLPRVEISNARSTASSVVLQTPTPTTDRSRAPNRP